MAESKEELKERLSRMKMKKLKKIADFRNIDTSGCDSKKDYINAILNGVEDEEEETKKQDEEEEEMETKEDAQIDETLKRAIDENVEFKEVEQSFLEIESIFESGKSKEAFEQIERAIGLGETSLERFQNMGLSLAILSSQKLIESVEGIDANDVKNALSEAKKHYADEMYDDAKKEVMKIKELIPELHKKQKDRLAELIYACEADIEKAKVIGAEIGDADHVIQQAQDFLNNDSLTSCADALRKAQMLADMGGMDRKTVIEETIEFVEKMIEDAKEIGTDVTEPLKHLEKVKELFEKEDYQMCMQTTIQVEQVTREAIHNQVEKAKALERSLEERYKMVASSTQFQEFQTEEKATEPEPEKIREGEHPCPDCGKPLNYIEEYKRWYCYHCQKYE
jgi:tetratricopeptide (TPR) repeat protein